MTPSVFYWMSEFLTGLLFVTDNNERETTWTVLFIYVLRKQTEDVWDTYVLRTVCLDLNKRQ